jgi:MFS family permease
MTAALPTAPADHDTGSGADPSRTVFAARAVRDFGDGFSAVLLPVHLTATLGLGAFEVGVAATVALLGSASMTLGIGMVGNRFDPRSLLLGAAALMAVSGLAFAAATSYAMVLAVAFLGTINPSAGSVSIFAPLEHTVLSRYVTDSGRTAMFARYALIGAMSAAVGALAAGSPEIVSRAGITQGAALKSMFVLYAALGVAAAALYWRLPAAAPRPAGAPVAALGPSRGTVYKLAALFSIDSFGGGFAVQSLMALWLFSKFGMSLAAAGVFFFWTGVLAAFSFPVAAWLSKRIGLINTMVYTHIPASLCLIGAALSPRLDVALGLLMVRSALSQMDVPARASYVMAVVTPAERPAAASFTAVPRSLASCLSPAIAGALFAAGYQALPFILCSVLKIAYDLALLWTFRHVKPPEEA